MQRYAKIQGSYVSDVVFSEQPPDAEGEWVLCGDASPGWFYVDGQFLPPPPVETWVITRNALQNRFPLTANGVSTKYDLAMLFLNDAGYAESLGVTGADLYSQRALLITANNRLGAVSSVNLQAQETIDYITMMQNPVFPEVFRLTQAEADLVLNTPAASNETP